LGGDRVFFREQAAFLDRRLVTRDDQLGFARIEDVGRRQSGGVLAAAVEDSLGAAVGEQVSAVADAFDDQRDRNVVDHEFEEFLGIFQFQRQRPALGNVVEQRNQEFGFVVFVARDDAIGGEDTFFLASLDDKFAVVTTFGGAERRLVGLFNARRGFREEDLLGALAHDMIAREAR